MRSAMTARLGLRLWRGAGLALLALAVARPLARAHDSDEPADRTDPAEEGAVHTPPGFKVVGLPAPPSAAGKSATLRVVVTDADTNRPAFCRVNVVGSDGNYYEPRENPLAPWSLQRLGNRKGKGPFRYYGWFFYSGGDFTVEVPPGETRVEAWKGFEYRPETASVRAGAGERRSVALTLRRTLAMGAAGYASGDTHLHFRRANKTDDERILDLMSAEDIRFGYILCLNDPGTYTGEMGRQDCPQANGFGPASVRRRGPHAIASGQEYRSSVYGHICLLLHRHLVREGLTLDPNRWPTFGLVAEEARGLGGVAIHAHGGYAQEIYADYPRRAADAVELLQFAVYRGISWEGWYHILNAGYRFPAVGASDYPYCRALGDARTYVRVPAAADPAVWARGAAEGRSFFTTGPMLLLEVDGHPPGDAISKTGAGPHRVAARVRVRSEVTPVARVELIVNGRSALQRDVPAGEAREEWFELELPLEINASSWIAARAVAPAPSGAPDAEAHTNPVYVTLDGKAPYQADDLAWLLQRLDERIRDQEKRNFPEKDRVVEYFRKAREELINVRDAGGQAAPGRQ